MKREEQIQFILKVIQKQRDKFPNVSDSEILSKTKKVCNSLVKSEDLDDDVVDKILGIVFKEYYDKKRKEEAAKAKAETQRRLAEGDPCGSTIRRSGISRGGC